MGFLQYGLRYVFPVQHGPVVRGIPADQNRPTKLYGFSITEAGNL